MKRLTFFLFILLILPLASAAQTSVDITITPNDIVREDVTLRIDAQQAYDEVRWQLSDQPLSVITDIPYRIENSTLVLERGLAPGEHTVQFALVFDDLVLSDANQHVLRLGLSPASQTVNASVTLPRGYVLADGASAVPRPDSITTDGQRIRLSWQQASPLSLAVTYEGPATDWASILLSAGALIITAGAGLIAWRRRDRERSKQPLRQTLSSNEQEVLDLVRSGVHLQKELVAQTGYSKSKMSKVVRNLELKGALRKEPHMRTNKLYVADDWR